MVIPMNVPRAFRIVVRRTPPSDKEGKYTWFFPNFANGSLLFRVVRSLQDSVHPPFIAGGRAEHASHQVIVAIPHAQTHAAHVFIHAKFFEEMRWFAVPREMLHMPSPHRAGSDCGCRIYPRHQPQLLPYMEFRLIRNLRSTGSPHS